MPRTNQESKKRALYIISTCKKLTLNNFNRNHTCKKLTLNSFNNAKSKHSTFSTDISNAKSSHSTCSTEMKSAKHQNMVFIVENKVALVTFKVLQRNSTNHCLLLRLAFKEAKSASEALRGGILRTSRRTLISSN